MEINALEKVIYYFGSTTQVAKVLGIKQQSVSGWCYGRSEVPLEIALHIELLMCGEVTWKDLVAFEIVYRLRNFCLSLKEASNYPCELTHVLMNRITVPNSLSKNLQEQPLKAYRPPCINENYMLIFGHEAVGNYQKNNKKTIPCWKLSLENLAEGKYVSENLVKAFSITERAAIGIALENFLGERRGKKNVHTSALFHLDKGIKTRKFVARHVGFGSHFTYQQAKEIFQSGCSKLIDQVNQQKISLSKGASLTKLTYEEQVQKLK